MQINELKKGLFGYKKESVYRYAVSMEDEMSRRIEETEQRAAETEGLLKDRIAELETMLRKAQEENRVLLEQMDAAGRAARLDEELSQKEGEILGEIRVRSEELRLEQEQYIKRVQEMRASLHDLLQETETRAKTLEEDMETLSGQSPTIPLHLFRRRQKNGEKGE